jgi:hypothetical protein
VIRVVEQEADSSIEMPFSEPAPLRHGAIPFDKISEEVTEEDVDAFRGLITTDLSEEQQRAIVEPPTTYPRQRAVLGVHWHPEFVPLELIRRRIEATFPAREQALLIPTQHNVLMTYDGLTGVEADCHSESFRRKVQILFHFRSERLHGRGDVFRAMLAHTAKYRASQLYEFIDSVVETRFEDRVATAAEATGASADLVTFVRIYVGRLKQMVDSYETDIPEEMIKNKLVRGYFDALRSRHDDRLINHAQLFLKAVKKIVKKNFSLEYFYRTEEFIEEVRSLGGCIIIPHPEQFWPILLADYDVDGIEVWNPQSYEYTRFLIDVVDRENKRHPRARRLLITMGDDCHMGEKVKDPRHQDPAKAGREIGVQPPWHDLAIRKRLIAANVSRPRVIAEYRERLG